MTKETILIKYHTDIIERLEYIDGKSDWIDLRAAEEVTMKSGEYYSLSFSVMNNTLFLIILSL